MNTKLGGAKTARRLIEREEGYYSRIGSIGGKAKFPNKGFAGMPKKKRQEAARKGAMKRKENRENA